MGNSIHYSNENTQSVDSDYEEDEYEGDESEEDESEEDESRISADKRSRYAVSILFKKDFFLIKSFQIFLAAT